MRRIFHSLIGGSFCGHSPADDSALDTGGHRLRIIPTPHVPHGWEAQVLFEETTGTLFCGDLFTRFGEDAPTTTNDIVEAALEAEQFGGPTALTPSTAPMIRQLANLDVTTLALMHGPAFQGDCTKTLIELGDGYDRMLHAVA